MSNKLYKKHSLEGNAELVLSSEIPAVRRFCHSATADARLREAKHYLRSPLFSLVTSLDIWTADNVHREDAKISESSEGSQHLRMEEAFSHAVWPTLPCPLLLEEKSHPTLRG
ncbi:hypothetical protein IMZ48_34935 [Candidatus Bathyarchaeota archaeon]|nr:hypothetical protein [Candidatus Bathyarchaeota archaeon]